MIVLVVLNYHIGMTDKEPEYKKNPLWILQIRSMECRSDGQYFNILVGLNLYNKNHQR